MTNAFLLLMGSGAVVAIAYLIVSFAYFLLHGAMVAGYSTALFYVDASGQGVTELFVMAVLMVGTGISLWYSWKGWRYGLQRLGVA